MPPQGSKKILIVEDEAFIADLYSRELQKAGYQVKVAADGASGLQLLSSEPFDLLLLDIMLPGMNGLELLRDWKGRNPNAPMIVLLLTNLGQDAVIKEGFTLGAQGYLIKVQYTPAQVVQEVNNALAGKPVSTPNPTSAQPQSAAPTIPQPATVQVAPTAPAAATPTPQPQPATQPAPVATTPTDPTKPQS